MRRFYRGIFAGVFFSLTLIAASIHIYFRILGRYTNNSRLLDFETGSVETEKENIRHPNALTRRRE